MPYAYFDSLRGAWDGEALSAYGGAGGELDETQEPVLRALFKEEGWFHGRHPDTECVWEARLSPEPLSPGDVRYPASAEGHYEAWALTLDEPTSDCPAFDEADWGAGGDPSEELLAHLPILSFAPLEEDVLSTLRQAVEGAPELDWADYEGVTFATWAHPQTGAEPVIAQYARAYALDADGDRLVDGEGRPVAIPVEAHEGGVHGAIEGLAGMGFYAWTLLS